MDLAILVGGTFAALVVIALVDRFATPVVAAKRPAVPSRQLGEVGEEASDGRLQRGLQRARSALASRLSAALTSRDDTTFDRLEEVLVAADIGTGTASGLVERVRTRAGPGADSDAVRRLLREEMYGLLAQPVPADHGAERPFVVLVTGVNGVGKTTTVAKLAARHQRAGRTVLLVAADTFRAAAGEQLEAWGRRLGVGVIRQPEGAAPAAVVFDGMKAAQARGVDVVLIDTAGRLHTRHPLVEELRKVRRVISDAVPAAPHSVLLVVDATTGQNAVSQARIFTEAVGVTGVVLTKLDGTARGGVALAIASELGIPITHLGLGEAPEDLEPFDAEAFVSALLGPVDGGDRWSGELQSRR